MRTRIRAEPPKAITRWLAAQRIRPTAFARSGSARPEVSSPCARSTDPTAKSAAIIPKRETMVARKAFVSPLCPPIRSKISRACALSPTMSAAPSTIPPKTSPPSRKPSDQPRSEPRWSRHASAPAEASRPSAGPGRVARKLAPTSLRPVSAYATAVWTRTAAPIRSSTHQRSPAKARTFSAQPKGRARSGRSPRRPYRRRRPPAGRRRDRGRPPPGPWRGGRSR